MKERQQAFLRKAAESIRAARLLWDNGHIEYAASRAYYAMFYIAEAFLEAEGMRFKSHSAVIAAFGKHFAKTGRVPVEFHQFLRRAEEVRLFGDYEPFLEVTAEQAQEQIERAERFLQFAEERLGGASR